MKLPGGLRAADEKTEVLLTDYLDGTLEARQRAELDIYLEQHPDQRAVLAELIAQSADLGALPREAAPAELADFITAHLERRALVEDAQLLPEPSRVRRWPQLAAIAACGLLAGGLVLATWWVLAPEATAPSTPASLAARSEPQPGPPRPSAAATPPAASAVPSDRAWPLLQTSPDQPTERAARQPADDAFAMAPPVEADTDETLTRRRASGLSTAAQGGSTEQGSADLGRAAALRRSSPEPEGLHVVPWERLDRILTLPSDNVDATRQQVEQWLREGGWTVSARAEAPAARLPWACPLPGPSAALSPLWLAGPVGSLLVVRVEGELLDPVLSALRTKTDGRPKPDIVPQAPAIPPHGSTASGSAASGAIRAGVARTDATTDRTSPGPAFSATAGPLTHPAAGPRNVLIIIR